jgi:signal transduction histidine kinase
MNLLILVASLCFLGFEYHKWKNNYKDFKTALDNNEKLEHITLNNNIFESQLIKDTIRLKNNEFYKKVRELQTSLEEINDYTTQWVHEIKIPISVCELISDKLAEAVTLEDIGKASEDMKMELERIKFLIDQILYASKSSVYSEDLSIEETNLEKVVKEVVKKNATFFISKKMSIQLNNLNYNVMTDRKWLSYILQQILNNSYKYTNLNGKIEISGIEDSKSIKLIIKDNGIGIPPKDIKRIFDKGFTGDNGRKTTRSTGIGLYFSRKMIDVLGHRIEVSSQINTYTEFTIIFYKLSDYLNLTEM